MRFNDYLEKLRQKPIKEKERMAIVATAVVFLIFFGIWLVSFSESGKNIVPEQSSSTIDEQLGDLKNSIGQGKQSIQDMMQNPSQSSGVPSNFTASDQIGNNANNNQNPPSQNPSENNSAAVNSEQQINNQDSQTPPQNNLPSGGNIPQLP